MNDTADDSLGVSAAGACRLANVGELTASALSAFCAGACEVDRDLEELLALNGDGRLQNYTTRYKVVILNVCNFELTRYDKIRK